MAELVIPGNNMPLGSGSSAQSSTGREDAIINKTKEMAFPTEAVISLENFEHYGPAAAGTQQKLSDMNNLTGKELSESYRVGHPKSEAMTDRVADR